MKLAIGQILLERAEFAHREDYLQMETGAPLPPSSIGLAVQVQRNGASPNAGALVRCTATSGDDAAYHFSVTYVVFYGMEWDAGESVPEDLDKRLMVTGATMLFPFLRETVASLTAKGRFGPSWLAPTDFNRIAPITEPQEALASARD